LLVVISSYSSIEKNHITSYHEDGCLLGCCLYSLIKVNGISEVLAASIIMAFKSKQDCQDTSFNNIQMSVL
jgi:hypothetical protein